jgi:hypothetical protein
VLYIDLNGSNNSDYVLFNQLGEEVLKGSFTEGKNALNTSQLNHGVYFLKVISNNTMQTIKLIK